MEQREYVWPLAKFIENTHYTDLSPQAIAVAKERLLDTVGAMHAGYAAWELRDALLGAIEHLGSGPALVFGGRRFSIADAALANVTLAHCIELDDGHRNAGCHAGAVAIPIALMLGEVLGSSAQELLTAIVLGYDIEYRIAANATPALIDRGYHPSTACAAFGAAAVAGKLLKLQAEQQAYALALAGAFTSGIKQTSKSAPLVKAAAVGNAAANGVRAAFLAQVGFTGPLNILEGPFGFYEILSDTTKMGDVIAGLGERYWIADTYTKMYPSCRHTHPAIEGVLKLTEGIPLHEIEAVEVGCYRVAYEAAGKIALPANAGEAKFSIPFCVAIALKERFVGTAHMQGAWFQDPTIQALANRTRAFVDPEIEALFPKTRGANVHIRLRSGETRSEQVLELKGSPGKPLTSEDLIAKFRANAKGNLREEEINAWVNCFLDFEHIESPQSTIRRLFAF